MVLKTFKRYELKYLLTAKKYQEMVAALQTHMDYDGYCINGAYYTIYNLYFDTENDAVIRHNLEKPYYKEKLRMRAYNIPQSYDPIFLELKKKIGGVVTKRRVVLPYDQVMAVLNNETIQLATKQDQQILAKIKQYLTRYKVKPKVYIGYERLAFFAKDDPKIRVSFDRNIRTRRTELALEKGQFGDTLLEDDMHLMEVKCSGAIPIWLSHLLAEEKLYKSSFSKYANAYKHYQALSREEYNIC